MSGSYAYVTGMNSDSLVVIDISNPASPAIRGSVVSSTLLDGVREAGSCTRRWPRAPRLRLHRPSCSRPRRHRLLKLSHSHSLALMCCAQPIGVAVSGSYAYVTAHLSDALVVVDVSSHASPVIRGSVASSSLMDYVRAELRARIASGAAACVRPAHHARTSAVPPPADTLSRSHALARTCCAHSLMASP